MNGCTETFQYFLFLQFYDKRISGLLFCIKATLFAHIALFLVHSIVGFKAGVKNDHNMDNISQPLWHIHTYSIL